MRPTEARHAVVSALLQAREPVVAGELRTCTQLSTAVFGEAVTELVLEGLVVRLRPGSSASDERLVWSAHWEQACAELHDQMGRELALCCPPSASPVIDVHSLSSKRFHQFTIERYTPPPEKRYLVFLQCSVRRPFSTSPSHAGMRRAIEMAVGHDPAHDRVRCPVHVVVLASTIGPVPYEFEDAYPANVRAGGVKQMGVDEYTAAKPILAGRIAEYLNAHGPRYTHVAAFADGRYGDVLVDALALAGVSSPIFPRPDGERVLRMGTRCPRPYWERFWIQLYREIVTWLPSREAEAAVRRLAARDVVVG